MEAAPRISRVGVFVNPTNPGAEPFLRGARAGAATLGLTVIAAEVRSVDDFEKAFTAVLRERSDSILVGPEALISSQRQRIAVFAAKNRLPSMYASTLFMDAGGLMAYSANPVDILRHASAYVDKILRGAKAGDLPVEQPTKFELVINLKTAKALGLTLPQSLLIRADRLIE
jgi:putative ABC transport system substrate-binding protein